jgi:trans-2-enoyl-CoA reductase
MSVHLLNLNPNVMLSFRRSFCSTSSALRHRALVYAGKGEPSDILRAVTFPPLPPAPAHTINVRILASPVNPSDVNVIQGVYPTRPNPAPEIIQASSDADVPVFVGGNECIAEVVSLGEGAEGLNAGDWGMSLVLFLNIRRSRLIYLTE